MMQVQRRMDSEECIFASPEGAERCASCEENFVYSTDAVLCLN